MNKGAGSVFQRAGSDNWWISFSVNGKRTRESSGSSVKKVAQDLLKERNGDTIKGLPVGRQVTKTTFEELIEIVQASYKANGHAMKLAGIVKHLSTVFGGYLANQITGDRLVKYSAQRQKEGAANATINRELAILRRAFTLAEDAGKVAMVPKFHLLKESNARKGFFDQDQYEAVLKHLPEEYRAAITTAYITGWRINDELFSRKKQHVDLEAGWLRLEPNESKNGEGRMFPLTQELRSVLTAQLESTRAYELEHGKIVPWLFHRNGEQIKGLRKAWTTACRKAGVPGKVLHDFRRTAVRNLERNGVSRSAAMAMVGHKTQAIYQRYAIVDEASLKDAASKIDRLSASGTV